MRLLFFIFASAIFVSCNNSGSAAKTFCDTTCKSDSFRFENKASLVSSVVISVKDCAPDSVRWTHGGLSTARQVAIEDLTNQSVRLNASALSCVIKDTSHAWLTFNDCITGRGYFFKLPFNKQNDVNKMTGALNSFDPKFSVAPDLRAYTDRGSIYVIDINTGKEAMMTFKETYDIDFDKIHEVVDSVNVTNKRIYVALKKEGKVVPIEKAIEL
ncbi:MAG: hypothetical protein V4676_13015 [Bacteroidota bacterium]